MYRIYPTADFKDGLVITYPKHIDDIYYLFYDQAFTKPVMDADMPSIFVNGAIMGDSVTRPEGFLPRGLTRGGEHNILLVSSTSFMAGEFAPEEDSEDDGDNSSDEPAGQ